MLLINCARRKLHPDKKTSGKKTQNPGTLEFLLLQNQINRHSEKVFGKKWMHSEFRCPGLAAKEMPFTPYWICTVRQNMWCHSSFSCAVTTSCLSLVTSWLTCLRFKKNIPILLHRFTRCTPAGMVKLVMKYSHISAAGSKVNGIRWINDEFI